MDSELKELLDRAKKFNVSAITAKKSKRALCQRCKTAESGKGSFFCDPCKEARLAERSSANEGRNFTGKNNGYVYTYKDGKLVLQARVIMEEILGHPIPENVNVTYRDGNKQNLDPSNLVLALKAGVPLDTLVCPHCQEPYYGEKR